MSVDGIPACDINMVFIGNGPPRVIPNKLKEHLNLKHICVISNSVPDYNVDKYLFYRDCVYGDYDGKTYQKRSLSKELLTSLSHAESQYLQMMERFEHWQGLVIFERRINLFHKQLTFWYNYIHDHNINLCVFMTIPHFGYDYVIYSLCKLLGIKILITHRIPVVRGMEPHVYIFEDMDLHIENIDEKYNYFLDNPSQIQLNSDIGSYLSLQASGDDTTTGVTKFKGFSGKAKKLFLPIANRIKALITLRKFLVWQDFFSRGIQLFRLIRRPNKFVVSPDLNQKYIYFPLHKQPEASTSPMGDVFVYQDLALNVLLEGLDKNTLVYVKPHVLKGNLYKFLERVKYDPRIIMIDPRENSFQLMKNSIAVATITGTVGWEAFLNGKNVLMFGNYFYQDAPNVYKISCCDDVSRVLQNTDKDGSQIETSKTKILAFLMALQNSTFSGWVDNRYAANSVRTHAENVSALSLEYAKKIQRMFNRASSDIES